MQESIFDIFGTRKQAQLCRSTVKPSSVSSFQALKGADNTRLKPSSASDISSAKKALGDVGNKLKSHGKPEEARKLLPTASDKDDSLLKPIDKVSLKNTKSGTQSPNKQTPNLKPIIRTPLADIKLTASPSNESIHKPSESFKHFKGVNSMLFEVESFITGNNEDLSWMQPDDNDYSPVDDFEDIIPMRLRPEKNDIHRMVNFWEMCSKPIESEWDPMCPFIEEPGIEFAMTMIPDIDHDEDAFPVPVPSED